MARGRPPKDRDHLTAAQRRIIKKKKKYDKERYRRLALHAKWGSPEYKIIVSKKGLARRKGPGHAATTRVLHVYRWNAKVNSVPFELTREEFENLIHSDCWYCGAPPSSIKTGKDIWSPLIYNGIDRVENPKGYVHGNVVPCCKLCNLGKRDMPLEEFLQWVERIHRTQEIRRQEN